MSAADVGRTVSRIAHQIIEKTALDGADAPRVVLLGIPTRGVTLADRLAANIAEFSGAEVARGALDITLYRDDLMTKPPRPLEATSIPAGGIDDALVILVDDVLYSGVRCARRWTHCATWGRPRLVAVGRAGRPRPPRAAAARRLCRQECADVAQRERARATPGTGRSRRRGHLPGGCAMSRHLLAAGDLSRAEATAILDDADRFAQALVGREVRKLPTLRGPDGDHDVLRELDRTRVSFEVAGKWMSADVINVSAAGSSVGKGESLRDTALTLRAAGADALIIRHPRFGRGAPACRLDL